VIGFLFPRRYLADQVCTVVTVFVVAGSVGFAVLAAVSRATGTSVDGSAVVALAAVPALLGAAAASFVASERVARRARAVVDPRFPHRDEIVDVVVRGRDRAFSTRDRELAVGYAAALRPYLAFQLAQMLLVYANVVVALTAMSTVEAPTPLVGWAVAAAVVAAGASVVVWVRQSGRIKRFLAADENAPFAHTP
jgi:hypothetical protein